MRVLLVEPAYKNKYPPLGLMKISNYHKQLHDEVVFVKGKNEDLKNQVWDRVYVSTLFTFHFKITCNTIKYYSNSVRDLNDIVIGGPMATLKADEIKKETELNNIRIHKGLLDQKGVLDENEIIIDDLIPDYSILNNNPYLNYQYPVADSYFIHITHGCIRKCVFCAVPIIEPIFKEYKCFSNQINEIISRFGEKRNIMIMDNNILASKHLDEIVDELVSLGYGKGNLSFNNKGRMLRRYVDFNQGLDARLLFNDKEIMKKLSKLEIKPMRVAFDHANDEFVSMYKDVMIQAYENKIQSLSNYILFNLDDTLSDLYKRLKINLELNDFFSKNNSRTAIWSFPMKFTPIFGDNSYDRKYIGKNWSKKYLRGIQCLLIPTHGVVGPKIEYFNHAFGENIDEFEKILLMPEDYIVHRNENTKNGNIDKWNQVYNELSIMEVEVLKKVIQENKRFIKRLIEENNSFSQNLLRILKMYL